MKQIDRYSVRFVVVDKYQDAKAKVLKVRVPLKYGKWQQNIVSKMKRMKVNKILTVV